MRTRRRRTMLIVSSNAKKQRRRVAPCVRVMRMCVRGKMTFPARGSSSSALRLAEAAFSCSTAASSNSASSWDCRSMDTSNSPMREDWSAYALAVRVSFRGTSPASPEAAAMWRSCDGVSARSGLRRTACRKERQRGGHGRAAGHGRSSKCPLCGDVAHTPFGGVAWASLGTTSITSSAATRKNRPGQQREHGTTRDSKGEEGALRHVQAIGLRWSAGLCGKGGHGGCGKPGCWLSSRICPLCNQVFGLPTDRHGQAASAVARGDE